MQGVSVMSGPMDPEVFEGTAFVGEEMVIDGGQHLIDGQPVVEQPNDPWDDGAVWPAQLFEPVPIPEYQPSSDPARTNESAYETQAALSDEASRRAMHPFSDLFNFQTQVDVWARRNFGEGMPHGTGSVM